jgi:hypothetical protein
MTKSMCVLATLASIACQGAIMCPSSQLEPTLNYGRAFGHPERATIFADLGATAEDEELIFQYFEYQTRDAPFAPFYAIHLLQDQRSGEGRAFLIRLKGDTPLRVETKLSKAALHQILQIASPIVSRTQYPDHACEAQHLDGFVIQAASGSPASQGSCKAAKPIHPFEGPRRTTWFSSGGCFAKRAYTK